MQQNTLFVRYCLRIKNVVSETAVRSFSQHETIQPNYNDQSVHQFFANFKKISFLFNVITMTTVIISSMLRGLVLFFLYGTLKIRISFLISLHSFTKYTKSILYIFYNKLTFIQKTMSIQQEYMMNVVYIRKLLRIAIL